MLIRLKNIQDEWVTCVKSSKALFGDGGITAQTVVLHFQLSLGITKVYMVLLNPLTKVIVSPRLQLSPRLSFSFCLLSSVSIKMILRVGSFSA